MGTFDDFVRYGLPGYIFIISVLFCLAIVGALPDNYDFYKAFAGVAGVVALVVGPLIGFIIHQVYFTYFDWKESYTKLTRKCILFIFNAFINSDKCQQNPIDENLIKKLSFITWKFLTTNFEKDFKIDNLFIRRLRSLRNFSHSFGSIITSSILSMFSGIVILAIGHFGKPLYIIIFFIVHFLLIALFYTKRKEILSRIDDLEIGMVLLRKTKFVDYLDNLIRLETENKDILSKVRGKPNASRRKTTQAS